MPAYERGYITSYQSGGLCSGRRMRPGLDASSVGWLLHLRLLRDECRVRSDRSHVLGTLQDVVVNLAYWPAFALADVRGIIRRASGVLGLLLIEPRFYFIQVPGHGAVGQCKALRELSCLFQFGDLRLRHGNHCQEL